MMYVNSFIPAQQALAGGLGASSLASGIAAVPSTAFVTPSGNAINYSFNPASAAMQSGAFGLPAASMAWGMASNPLIASGVWNPALASFGGIQSSVGMVQPRIELAETNTDIVVTAELPNVNLNDLKLTVTDDSLSIAATALVGGVATSLYRTVALPTTIRAEHCDASYSNGILEARLPKSDFSTRRRIRVNVAG